MKEQMHTPGPWSFDSDGICVGPNSGFQPVGACGCCQSPWIMGDTDEQKLANANLMISAPDLLAALEPFGKAAEGAAWPTFENDTALVDVSFNITVADLRKARAAIAKAKATGQ